VTGPDRGELERWAVALGTVADRIRAERGIEDPWRLSIEDGVLWALYGELRVRLGPGAEVRGEDDLFDEVDGWVAHDRRPGPGQVLDRDREARAAWRAGLPALRAFWEPLVERVLADVVRTTDVDVSWSIDLDEWQVDVPPTAGLQLTFGDQPLPVREADFPQWVLRLPHQGFELPAVEDEDDAVAHLASRVQDYVVEELPGAWPVCPGHPHPMEPAAEDVVVWRCPAGAGATHEVGRLPPV